MADDSSDADTLILLDYEYEIKKVLPHIKDERLERLKEQLIELGITSGVDLTLVKESDLTSVSVIESRRLVSAWSIFTGVY